MIAALAAACGGESVRRGGAPEPAAAGSPATTGASGASAGAGTSSGGATAAGAANGGAGGHDVPIGTLSSGGATGGSPGASAGAGDAAAPGCPPAELATCSPGPAQFCDSESCMPGVTWPQGIDERGGGVICKYSPDDQGPDFACVDGEWCQYEIPECRCGKRSGCQLGERCELCTDGNCVPGNYYCVRDIACTADNLDRCAAEPGQVCASGALVCEPAICTTPGAGNVNCPDAPSGCCPANEWCFDGRECRCGVDPSCTGGEACELNSVGLYRCGGRVR